MSHKGSKRANTGRPTVFSIAEQAGVSIATVSRALNNDPVVHKETGDRIRKLAQELGFKPSPIASRLAGGRTGMVAMLVPTARNPIYAALVEEVTKVSRARNYELLVAYAEVDAPHEREILGHFRYAQVDGFIIVTQFWLQNRQTIIDLAKDSGNRPIVVRNAVEEDCPLDSVCLDFRQATFDAATYLIQKGHRRISYLGYPPRVMAGDRPAGFKQALEEAAIALHEDAIVYCGEKIADAYQSALKLLQKKTITALVVQSDYLALGVLRAAKELGINIPRDLSIIAFDGIEIAAYGAIPLTTMAQPLHEVAMALVDCLSSRITGDSTPPVRKTFHLILREGYSVAECTQ